MSEQHNSLDQSAQAPESQELVDGAPSQPPVSVPALSLVPSLLLIAMSLSIDPINDLITLLEGGSFNPGTGGKRGW